MINVTRHRLPLARQLGFSGKLAIHPRQLETIHAAFAPSDQEVMQARRVLKAFDEAQRIGKGVAVLDGEMIDRPMVERARRIIVRSCVRNAPV